MGFGNNPSDKTVRPCTGESATPIHRQINIKIKILDPDRSICLDLDQMNR